MLGNKAVAVMQRWEGPLVCRIHSLWDPETSLQCEHWEVALQRQHILTRDTVSWDFLIWLLASQSEAERKNLATSVFSDCSGTLVCECRWSCFFFFLPCCVTCGVLVPWSGIEPGPSAVRVEGPNHWTSREFSRWGFSLVIGMGCRW